MIISCPLCTELDRRDATKYCGLCENLGKVKVTSITRDERLNSTEITGTK